MKFFIYLLLPMMVSCVSISQPDIDSCGKEMLEGFNKNRIFYHGYCRRNFKKIEIDFKDISFSSCKLKKTYHKEEPEGYDVTVSLAHPEIKRPIAIAFDALEVDGRLKVTDGQVVKVYFAQLEE